MRVKYLGETGTTTLVHGKVYDVIGIEGEWYRIIDEDDDDDQDDIPGYLYSPELFEIVEG